jgi:4'-phosphopantetheinyl transferase
MSIRELESGKIELWTSFLHEIVEDRLLDQYKALLAPKERIQQVRFHFERDQHRYLITRALVRVVLSKYCDIEPKDWVFNKGSHGKPVIGNNHSSAMGLFFNISHTNGVVIVGVSREPSLGVDVENLDRRKPSLGIAETFFASAEVEVLRELSDLDQQRRFYEYWTLKESYIKAVGLGLSIPLDKFSFSFPTTSTIRLALADNPEHADQWHFWQFQPASGYMAAVCINRTGLVKPVLTNTKIVPMLSESPLELSLLRTS